MSGLVLKLAPKERLLVNGAVIENGDRRSRIHVLTPKANILRLKDAIHPDEANTPVKRACYLAQLLLSGDADTGLVTSRLEMQITDLTEVFRDTHCADVLASALTALRAQNNYICLKRLRELLPLEQSILRSYRG
ncbi:flagellar biosynthesis repressor FlbT [Marivita hallyeonensis]|uniref:Flagellar protein FlbT n=1 Tax=Marivita hallyeonensis TaxID=996342 RepID=A0A1M5ULN0_9RHOB|nr:flagellar biosynthesis repressor FlbT [Marivita hallyeonensis]SHH63904.1 flagellar protein FlbT [Marivita hallyeonensis]